MTHCPADAWTIIKQWQIPRRYELVLPGAGMRRHNHETQQDRNTRRLDKLQNDPYGTLRDWARDSTETLWDRLRKHARREQAKTIHAEITDEDGQTIHGELRITVYDPLLKDQLAVDNSYRTRQLAPEYGRDAPRIPMHQPGMTEDRYLVAEFLPEQSEKAEVEEAMVSFPVTVYEPDAPEHRNEIRSTTARWSS